MKYLLVILSFVSATARSQSLQVDSQVGYNRIGVFFTPNVGLSYKCHVISFGTKIYGYNLFFESNRFGPQIGYKYLFETDKKKVYFFPTLTYSMCREQKPNSNLLLSEFNFKYGIGLKLNAHISLMHTVGMGFTLTNSNLFNELITIKNAYPGFETSLGLVYSFSYTDH